MLCVCVSFNRVLAQKDTAVILRVASTISTFLQCDRFIKMALPAFTTSIIKANPIMLLTEILNILQPAIERQILVLSIVRTTASSASINTF